MKQWLLGVVGASLLSSLALMLCPGGRVKAVTKMVCALVCALAMLEPLMKLDMGSLSAGLAAYRQQAQSITENEEETAKMVQRTYIQEQCAAYILTQAQSLTLSIEAAEVLALWDAAEGVWYPWEATVTGPYDRTLARQIEEDLGIPEERQQWTE